MKNDTRNYKYAAPAALMLTSPHVEGRGRNWGTPENLALPFTIYDSRFTNCN